MQCVFKAFGRTPIQFPENWIIYQICTTFSTSNWRYIFLNVFRCLDVIFIHMFLKTKQKYIIGETYKYNKETD